MILTYVKAQVCDLKFESACSKIRSPPSFFFFFLSSSLSSIVEANCPQIVRYLHPTADRGEMERLRGHAAQLEMDQDEKEKPVPVAEIVVRQELVQGESVPNH